MAVDIDKLNRRAAINRANALKSTGPKTEAGKQKSALNALRHGLTGQVIVLPTEDLSAYERFVGDLHKDCKPVGALETQMVQSLADDSWRLNRAKAMETNLFALGLNEKSDSIDTENPAVRDALAIASALEAQTKSLSNLSLHQTRIARSFERTLKQLLELQAQRREIEKHNLDIAAKLLNRYEIISDQATDGGLPPLPPYDPAEDGFVFTLAEVQQYADRKFRRVEAYFLKERIPTAA